MSLQDQISRLKALTASASSSKTSKKSPAAWTPNPITSKSKTNAQTELKQTTNSGSTQLEKRKREPEVVVFDQPSTKKTFDVINKRDKRAFMSSDVSKMQPKATKPGDLKQTQEDIEQDREDDRLDRELMDLLNSSDLVDSLAASQLEGKERRDHVKQKLLDLGAKKEKIKTPAPISVGLKKAKEKTALKRLQQAKDMGLYHSSLRTQIMGADAPAKPKAKKTGELKASIGSFRNGVLTVPKSYIAEVEKSRAKPSSRGGRGGGTRGRGGRGGGRGGKR
ncbi:hypothetical protein HDU76_001640 [Blyttiomyces sp. JEL0837]|nr:hypothetical protein HDU76_001640 [Blyttiomyces sp. JEL0837]